MARRGGVKVYIDGDTTGLNRALSSGERRVQTFGRVGASALRGMTTAGIALGAAGAAGIVYSVNAASDLGEELSKVGVVFRSSGREVQQWSKSTADAFGISRREALASAGVFGNMLVPMGLARQKAADMSTTMVELAGDMSSFNNASPQETLDALRAGLAGETEPLRRFGVFLDAARIKQEAINLGLAKGTEELSAAAKAQATYSLILKDTRDAQGDASRTGDQLAGGLRRLKAQSDDVSSSLGTMFIPPLESGLAFVNNEVLPGLQGAADDLAAIWGRPDITPQKAFEDSWAVIEETGFPDAAKEAIYQGLTAAATNAPKVFMRAMEEAPWPAKAVLAGIFLAKFGPGIRLAGAGLGKILGTSAGTGAAPGGLGALAGAGRPVPVLVTNPGFTAGGRSGAAGLAATTVATTAAGRRIPLVGGLPAGGLVPGLIPTAAPAAMWRPGVSAAAGRALPGMAAGVGVGSLAHLGLSAAGVPGGASSVLSGVAGGAATGATMGAAAGPMGILVGGLAGATAGGLVQGFRTFGRSGEVEKLEERTRRTTERLAEGLSDRSRGKIERAVRDMESAQLRLERTVGRNILTGAGSGGMLPDEVIARRRAIAAGAENRAAAVVAGNQRTVGLRTAQEFVRGLNEGAKNVTQADLWKATIKRFDGMSEEGRKAGAATVIKWAQAAEREGRVPKGTADRLVRDLRGRYAELETALPTSAKKAIRQFNAELGAKGATRNAGRVLDSLKDAFSDAPRFTKTTMDNVGRQYEEAIDFLTRKSRTGSKEQRADARKLLAEVRAAYAKVKAANRELGDSYDAPRAALGRLRLAASGAGQAIVQAWSAAATSIESSSNEMIADYERMVERLSRRPGRRGDGAGAASGGFTGWTPGVYTGRDPYLLAVDGDEAILNPRQQEMIPGGRATLSRIFAATGGVIGGDGGSILGFAGGGYVNPVPGGNWKHGPGGGTHSRSENGYVWQDDDAWDIMGSDGTPVVAGFDGVIGRVSPFNPDPRYWGHGLYLQGLPGTLFYKHLKTVAVRPGQRVAAGDRLGVLGDGVNGGAHLHLGASPIGLLQSLRSGRAASGSSDGPGEHGSTSDEQKATPRQALLKALRTAGITGKAATGIANRTLGAGADIAGSVAGRTGGGEMLGQRAGREAAAGYLNPERGQIDPEREDALIAGAAERKEAAVLRKDLAVIQRAITKVQKNLTALRKDEKRLLKRPAGKRKQALRLVRQGMAKGRQQLRALRESELHVLTRLDEIGESAARLAAEQDTEAILDQVEGIADVISAAGRDDSLQDKQATRAGVEQAAAEGITNTETQQAYGERAMLQRRRGEIEQLMGQVQAAINAVVKERQRLQEAWAIHWRNLQRTPRKRKVQRQRYRDAIARVNASLELLDGQESGLIEQWEDLRASAAELDWDIGELNVAIAKMPRLAEDTGTSDTAAATNTAAEQQARADAEAARREAGLSNSFIRAALSPGDIDRGGLFAMDAAGGAVTIINTLHPSDPQTLLAIQRANAAAAWLAAPRLAKATSTGL